MNNPAIVVIAYDRLAPLERLLKSLAAATYPSENITLHISIDASINKYVKIAADDFEWKHGNKIVELKEQNHGLLKHVLECGKLTEKYGSIIVLEDDLIVAPGFYNYALKANDFYSKEGKIAGVSLFTYPVEENNFYPFQPIQDESDVHFIQVASSWGQSWNHTQWSKFTSWLTDHPNGKSEQLPDYIQKWGNNSWKRLFINYMIDTDRYFVFPNTSYSSNFEEEGTHASDTGLFQVNMHAGVTQPRFKFFNDSNSIYDVYFELLPTCLKRLCPSMSSIDFEVDIYGEKPTNLQSEFVLTSRRSTKAERSFGSKMKPLVQNILFEIEGEDLVLCRKEDLALTEENRFLLLNASSVELEQLTQTRSQKLERVSLIIPVLNDQLEGLSATMKSLKTDRFYDVTLVVVCSAEIKQTIQSQTNRTSVKIEIVHCPIQELDECLRIGFANCSTEYCGWIQPGMLVDLKRIEDAARIFQRMAQVQVIHGLQCEVHQKNYANLNISDGRWTPQMAIWNKSEAIKTRSELFFWRTSILSEKAIAKLKSETIFIELLKLNPVYIVALKFGDFGGIARSNQLSVNELQQILNAPDFQPKKGIQSIFRPIFHFWFRRNVPIFRLFYREMEQLPLVIRYDFKNDSFYLSNY